jgi:hypothetical protein
MPKLYVYLYENGKKDSFANLSGQELQSIIDAVDMYGDLDADAVYDTEPPTDYATMEVSDEDAQKVLGKRTIQPKQYGLHKWGKVELEFLTTPANLLPEIQEKVAKRGQRVAIDETLTKNTRIPDDVIEKIKGYAVGKGKGKGRKTRKNKKTSKKTRRGRGRK